VISDAAEVPVDPSGRQNAPTLPGELVHLMNCFTPIQPPDKINGAGRQSSV
jgi:hypothetical protein